MTRGAKTLSVDPGSTDITGFNALRHRSTAPMKLSNNYRLSAIGPKQTSLAAPHMSALGGKAECLHCKCCFDLKCRFAGIYNPARCTLPSRSLACVRTVW